MYLRSHRAPCVMPLLIKTKTQRATGRGLCDSDLQTRLLFLPSGLQPCGTAERLTQPASPLASPAWPDPPALAPTGPRRRCRRLGCQRDRALSRWRREMVIQQQQFKDKLDLDAGFTHHHLTTG